MEYLEVLPNEHLNNLSKLYPGAWSYVNDFRQSRGVDLPKWPDWCFLPMAAWYAIVDANNNGEPLSLAQSGNISKLAAVGAWRYTQGIYRFDPDFYSIIKDTIPNGDIPTEVLYRLPEWCVYVETPGMDWLGSALFGFWCHLEWDVNTAMPELRFLFNTDNNLIGLPVHLGKWTLTEAVDRAINAANHQLALRKLESLSFSQSLVEQISKNLYGIVSLVLYLCSEEPEVEDERQPGKSPERPQAKRTKRGWQFFPADKPRVWEVGKKMGSSLRTAQKAAETSQNSKKPHVRRAHWHGFWTGPKEGDRKFIYRWLPPMFVGG